MGAGTEGSDTGRGIDEIVRGLYRIFQDIDHFSRRSQRELGVTGPLLWALRTIRDAECTTVDDLARRIHLPPGTVSGLLDRLEERGAAARRGASEDERVIELRLTSSGRLLASRAPDPPLGRIARGIERLSPEELAGVRRAVGILIRLLEDPDAGPGTDASV